MKLSKCRCFNFCHFIARGGCLKKSKQHQEQQLQNQKNILKVSFKEDTKMVETQKKHAKITMQKTFLLWAFFIILRVVPFVQAPKEND